MNDQPTQNLPQKQDSPQSLDPDQDLPNPTKIKVLSIAKKIVAIGLILFSLYHIYEAAKELLFVLPKISFIGNQKQVEALYVELIKKAIILSTGLFFDSFYGFALLVKPGAATKIIHIVFGVILFFISNFLFNLASIDQLLKNTQFFPLT